MKHISIFILLCTISFLSVMSQKSIQLHGRVVEEETQKPLAYASIGIFNKSVGTLTDSLGNFHLMVDKENLLDTLLVSLVGYTSKYYKLNELANNQEIIIPLSVKYLSLPEVLISNKTWETEVQGRQSSGKLVQVSIHNNKSAAETIGSEMGMKYKTKQKNALLKDFNFYLSSNNFHRIKFSVNVYSMKDNMPDTLLTREQVIITLAKYKTGWTKVDLEPYLIQVPAEFIVTVQWLEGIHESGEDPVTLIPTGVTTSKNCFVRVASQDRWKRMAMQLSNYVTLIY
jgi:CarboxypepD_reg-like domain